VQQEETCEQLREDLARARADFINYRRRTESLATRRALEATAELAGELLPVFDALDLAPAAAADDPVFRLLIASLTRAGLTSFGAIGEIFDPTKHDAVAATHSEDTPIVLRVLRSGYQWNEVLLRPAMVEVG
jgi:molecular chaperone GrpE